MKHTTLPHPDTYMNLKSQGFPKGFPRQRDNGPPLPVVAVDQIEDHHICGVDKLALDRHELPICRALGGRLVSYPMQETTVAYLTAPWT